MADGARSPDGGHSTAPQGRHRGNGAQAAGKDANGMNGLSHAVKLWHGEI
jgi:hypothetical protein